MDIRNYFLDNRNILSEEYLSALASKGLYKRALKDLEKVGDIKWKIKENEIEFEIGENKISLSVDKGNCSCISRTICRHIISAYIYLGEHFNEIIGIPEEKRKKTEGKKADFSKLLDYDYRALKSEKNKFYLKALEKLKGGVSYGICEGKVVEVKSQDYKVVFFPGRDIKDAKCSCFSEEVCSHKLEALAFYRAYKGMEDSIINLKSYSSKEIKVFKFLNEQVRKNIENILKRGLIRYRDYYILEQLALKVRKGNMPDFERALKRLLFHMDAFSKKKASFNINFFRKELLSFYEKILLLENALNKKETSKISVLIGKFKDEYVYGGTLELFEIGIEKFKRNEYSQKNVYFLEKEGKIYNLGIYEGSIGPVEIWNEVDISRGIYGCSFTLEDSYISENNKISTTSKSTFREKEKGFYNPLVEEHSIKRWSNLLSALCQKQQVEAILKILNFEEGTFDHVRQEKSIIFEDEEGKILNFYIPYRTETKKAIEYLESMEKGKKNMTYIFAKFYVEKEKIYMLPVSKFYENKKLDFRRF